MKLKNKQMAIEVSGVNMVFKLPKRYREHILHPFRKPREVIAVSDASISIEHGDSIAFLGPNGAGKTTLLKIMGGLLYPTKGKVTVNGYESVFQNDKAREKIGYVINEDRSFYWRLTGRQNLEFFGTLDNVPAKALHHSIQKQLEFVSLEIHADKQVYAYSSGMRQRLAIARALLSYPDILILDEPTRTLDPVSAVTLRGLIYRELHKALSKTLLVATHQVQEVEALCNKICVINNGKILAFESLKNAKKKHGSVAKFYESKVGKVT